MIKIYLSLSNNGGIYAADGSGRGIVPAAAGKRRITAAMTGKTTVRIAAGLIMPGTKKPSGRIAGRIENFSIIALAMRGRLIVSRFLISWAALPG